MPENLIDWLLFWYFAIGALGGWIALWKLYIQKPQEEEVEFIDPFATHDSYFLKLPEDSRASSTPQPAKASYGRPPCRRP